MKALRLIAGKNAKARIADQGLTPELVRLVLGASGGPKWLILRGLDQFVFGDWLANSDHKIDLIGSSIGAWRMTCAAHPDAASMFNHFEKIYFSQTYDQDADLDSVTAVFSELLEQIFTEADKEAIVSNTKRGLHIVAVKGRGLAGSNNKYIEAAGIALAAAVNLASRRSLALSFKRANIFSGSEVAFSDQWNDYGRIDIPLTANNLSPALLASGSIPFVIDPIRELGGDTPGIYRDGGVIDYHFDIPWDLDEGIVLYPHFYPYVIPGWFDKNRKSRRVTGNVFDNMLMLAPHEELVSQLPGGKIPERRNFIDMRDEERLKYWQHVVGESKRMADQFAELLQNQNALMDAIEDAPV